MNNVNVRVQISVDEIWRSKNTEDVVACSIRRNLVELGVAEIKQFREDTYGMGEITVITGVFDVEVDMEVARKTNYFARKFECETCESPRNSGPTPTCEGCDTIAE